MTEQRVPSKSTGGARRGAQAVAGIASAVACLGIGWAVGIRSAVARATPTPVSIPITQPFVPTVPSGSGDDNGGRVQWGTVPGSAVTSAQPGTGISPPSTGSGGSTVATTSALAPTTTSARSRRRTRSASRPRAQPPGVGREAPSETARGLAGAQADRRVERAHVRRDRPSDRPYGRGRDQCPTRCRSAGCRDVTFPPVGQQAVGIRGGRIPHDHGGDHYPCELTRASGRWVPTST